MVETHGLHVADPGLVPRPPGTQALPFGNLDIHSIIRVTWNHP